MMPPIIGRAQHHWSFGGTYIISTTPPPLLPGVFQCRILLLKVGDDLLLLLLLKVGDDLLLLLYLNRISGMDRAGFLTTPLIQRNRSR